MPVDSRILFHWKSPASDFAQRMIIASIAAISIHVLCFYVFQVQEPQSARTLPRTYGVTYLFPSDPSARRILQQIDDYYAAYMGTLLADSTLHMPLGSMDYKASYEQLTPTLMGLPEREHQPLSALGPKGRVMVLPPIPQWTPPANRKGAGSVFLARGLQLTLPEAWAERYEGPGDFDWSTTPGKAIQTWRLWVRPDGAVARVEAVGSATDDAAMAKVREGLEKMRFAAGTGGEAVWLEIQLQWDDSSE